MNNTEGSQVITQVYKARKNLKLYLSKKQMFILLGSILGDCYIYPKGKVSFEHGEKQKKYLFWKYVELKNLAYPKVAQVIRFDKRRKVKTISWRFFLRQYFRPLRNIFYKNKKNSAKSNSPMVFSAYVIYLVYGRWIFRS